MRDGDRIGPYLIERRLGAGGMGAVYRARDPRTGAAYAVKVLAAAADPEMRMRFQREGEAHARVDGHPNVVRVHTAGRDGERVYLAMDLVEGGDLASRLRTGPLPIDEAAGIVRDLARGLAHLHARGVLHRDLKPANVLVDAEGRPKLADFGLARLAGSASLTETGAILGTPAYMAPEQALSEEEEVRTDVYGLGAVLYHLLSGAPPYDGPALAVMTQIAQGSRPPALRSRRADCPASLEAICRRAMAAKPADRYPTAEALGAALDAYLRGEAPEPERSLPPLALGLAALAVVAMIALVRVSTPDQTPATDVASQRATPAPTSPLPSPAPRPQASSTTSRPPRRPGAKKKKEKKEGWWTLPEAVQDPVRLIAVASRHLDSEGADLVTLQMGELIRKHGKAGPPWLANAYFLRGRALLYRTAYDEAREDFDVALRLKPNFSKANLHRGRVHFAQQRWQQAFLDSKAALAGHLLDDGKYDALVLRANARLKLDTSARARKRAREDYLGALEQRAGLSAREGLVRLALLEERPSQAERELEPLVRALLSPKDKRINVKRLALALVLRGRARLALYDGWGAQEDLRTAVRSLPEQETQPLSRAIAASKGQYAWQATAIDPKTALSRIEAKAISSQQQIGLLTRALQHGALSKPERAVLLYRRAQIFMEPQFERQQRNARDDLAWARELDPTNPSLQALERSTRAPKDGD